VKTTVERQIAGVASSYCGDETEFSFCTRPVVTYRRRTSQPLELQVR
jgi:hypothetical protein